MLDFKELEAALGSIEAIGMDELEFPIEGKTVVLRALLPSEEVAIQRAARKALDEGESSDMPTNVDYLDKFKTEALAYSIVQVGDIDLRKVTEVPTGEKMKEGTPITIQKHVAMRQLLRRWGRPVVNVVFRKLGELASKIEARADKAVKFEPSDLEAERDRLKARLEEVEGEIAEREKPPEDPMRSHFKNVEALVDAESEGMDAQSIPQQPQPSPAEEEIEPDPEVSEPEVRRAVEPRPIPMQRTTAIPASAPPPPPVSRPVQAGTQPKVAPPQEVYPEDLPTYFDASNEGEAEAMLAAEHERQLRLLRMRRTAAPAPSQEIPSLQMRPPHMAAAEADFGSAERPVSVGQENGREVYQMPPAVVPLLKKAPAGPAPTVNSMAGGTANKRFQSPPKS